MHPVVALYRHHAWATASLLDFCHERPDAVAAPADVDVYGDVTALFNHIVDAETWYLRLVTGERPDDRVDGGRTRPLRDLRPDLGWLKDRWISALAETRDPDVVLPYQRGDDPEVMADWVPLVQTVHHGDDHRTQVNTLLSRHSIESPNLDAWAFGEIVSAEIVPTAGWWAALLRRFIGHHMWATEQLLRFCAELSSAELAQTAPGTFGDLAATLDHLISADRSYISRLRGGPPTPSLHRSPDDLLEVLRRDRTDWLGYLDSDPDFNATVPRGEAGDVAAWIVVAQAVHHGNDHRTHAGTVLLRHGLESPNIDVWRYAMAEGALRPLGAT